MKAKIFEIKRFAVHDGDGIRTTVFFKGCPLKCKWCHNPEGLSPNTQLAFYSHKCISCGECTSVCPTGAHYINNDTHCFDRAKCIACGKCKDVCLGNALTIYGKEYTIDELVPLLLKDKDFYDTSGGGVTLSGGECLLYADYCAELLKTLKENDVNTAIDTCGYVPQTAIDKVLPYADVFLYDVKAISSNTHKTCTEQHNDLILSNLLYLDSKNAKIEVRIPFVPNFNDTEIEEIGKFLKKLNNLTKVKLLPYHNYAKSKYNALDIENTLPENLPTEQQLQMAKKCLESFNLNVVLD